MVERLRVALLIAAATEVAVSLDNDQFGTRYLIDFALATPDGSATIRRKWIVRPGEDVPRLTTCSIR